MDEHVAIKCTWQDGGSEGFEEVCSIKIMRLNVMKRVWCSQKDNPCRQFLERGQGGGHCRTDRVMRADYSTTGASASVFGIPAGRLDCQLGLQPHSAIHLSPSSLPASLRWRKMIAGSWGFSSSTLKSTKTSKAAPGTWMRRRHCRFAFPITHGPNSGRSIATRTPIE